MATYPPRRLLGARPLPSDPRRDPRRSGFPQGGGGGGGGSPRHPRGLCTHFQGPAARHRHLPRSEFPSAEPKGVFCSPPPFLLLFLAHPEEVIVGCGVFRALRGELVGAVFNF
ncbi:uncharacterized protein LOC133768569 isoform X4 [Lepus europaeus]|uniref:uncharacterized protein LOC133768569 isoform X4 n=1 Tax=Lepus europaeus TaxID=9983 RepID=UPI002B48E9B9|nr:uncharacterized protein LOC133768569 isoform X4 [Lepus europaeus]